MNQDPKQQLAEHLQSRDACYVFIDRSVPFPLSEALQTYQVEFMTLDDPIFNQTQDISPILASLEPAKHQDLIEALIQVAYDEASKVSINTRSVCAFLFSTQSLGALAAQLKRQMDLQVTDFGGVYFRYFDPRVAPELIALLTPEQHWQWLHQIETWFYFDWQGELQTLPKPPSVDDVPKQRALSSSTPTVSLAQWEKMDGMALQNKAIQALRKHGHGVDYSLNKKIAQALNEAKQLGFSEARDQVSFAEYSIHLNIDLQKHPQFESGLDLVQTHLIPFKDVLEDHMNLSINTSSN